MLWPNELNFIELSGQKSVLVERVPSLEIDLYFIIVDINKLYYFRVRHKLLA